jgi:serine/threonine-protein kinase
VARGALVGIGLVLVAAGGAGVGYGVTRKAAGGMAPEGTAAMGAAVSSLDGDIKAARAAVHERAGTISQVEAVRAAIGTDAATAKDMAREAAGRGELAFKPQPGEVIELGQLPDGGKFEVLLTIPPDGMHSSHDNSPGDYAELAGDRILITEVVAVKTTDPTKKLTGFVTVSRPLELKGAIDRLTAAGIAGRFEIGGKTRVIGTPVAGATDMPMKLPSQPDAQLVVAAPPVVAGMPMSIVGGGAGAAGLGVILLVVGAVTGRKREVVASSEARTVPSRPGETKLTGQQPVAAAGTPSPVADLGSQPINLKAIIEGGGGMIGRWEVVRRIGSGGMADVFLARSRGEAGFEKLVAIKVMHSHLARNERAVEHFLDEARLAARIHHPNVVAIQDLGKIGDDYVIVMEYVDGVDLERLLANARMGNRLVPVDVGLGILCRICDGLQAAHTAVTPEGQPLNLIHRDVKSANVLVSRQGVIKVVDFGIAKAAKQGHFTVAGETKGTPSMMAPEQRVGEEVDVRADVYAVAAVGYEVVTGHGVNLDLAALAHLGIENWPHLPLPSSLRPNLPPELDEILLTTMSFERDKRPATCAALEDKLEAVMKRHGLSASDKDIARWVQSELAQLRNAPPALDMAQTKPAGAS